ncbi:MmgE/PrpD family protein [Nocardia vaccinii]|uniref:MmgE/PrpD family protein n=1 Tax=Nocardia vaccinii TaxID=1822 RepID=UPI000AF10FE7|nr:MmgE/PrpD family protein [Nocardia vaccinii]
MSTTSEITDGVVELAAFLTGDDMSADAISATKMLVLDSLACTVAGVTLGSGGIVEKVLTACGGVPESTVIGSGDRLPALVATYVNCHAANALDADETVRYKGHIAAATVPTAIAFGEKVHASGMDVLTAIAVGYEVATRYAQTLQGIRVNERGETEMPRIGGYSWVGLASTVAAGRLLRLDATQMRMAIGIAGSTLPLPASTPFGLNLPRPMTKYLMYGAAAHSGALAALLAAEGFTGEVAILDGDAGLWAALGSLGADPGAILAGAPVRWAVEDACYKAYPGCRFNAPAIDLYLELVAAESITPDQVMSIEVLLPAAGLRKHKADRREVETLVDATFSLPHLLGCAAYLSDSMGPAWVDDSARTDPRIRDFAARVQCDVLSAAGEMAAEDLAQHGHLTRMPTKLTVVTDRGVFTRSAEYARGDVYDSAYAFEFDDVARKFRQFTKDVLTEEGAENTIASVAALDQLTTLDGLMSACSTRKERVA